MVQPCPNCGPWLESLPGRSIGSQDRSRSFMKNDLGEKTTVEKEAGIWNPEANWLSQHTSRVLVGLRQACSTAHATLCVCMCYATKDCNLWRDAGLHDFNRTKTKSHSIRHQTVSVSHPEEVSKSQWNCCCRNWSLGTVQVLHGCAMAAKENDRLHLAVHEGHGSCAACALSSSNAGCNSMQ